MKKTSVQPVKYMMVVFLYLFPTVFSAPPAGQIPINYNFINVHSLYRNYMKFQAHIFPSKTKMEIQAQITFSLQ